MYCQLTNDGPRACKCEVCGKTRRGVPDCKRAMFHCDGELNGLGDKTERVLAAVGITEPLVKRAKRLLGLSPKCGCKKRKEWLNKVSDWWQGE